MKKSVILASTLLVSTAFGKLSDEQILSMFDLSRGVEAKIDERSQLEGSNLEQIIIAIKSKTDEMRQVFFTDGKYLFPDVIDVEKKISYAGDFQKAEQEKRQFAGYKKLGALLKTYPQEKIMELGDSKKELMYVFTDPLCPYCQEELKNIETTLKEYRLKLVFTPLASHGEDAVARSLAIQEQMKSAKTDAEKIALLRKYYDKANAAPEYKAEKIKKEQEIVHSIFATGAIRGVPAFIEASNLEIK